MGAVQVRHSFLLIVFFIFILIHTSTAVKPCGSHLQPRPRRPPMGRNVRYILSSCNSTLYPSLCYHSLSVYASKINTNPKLLVHTALTITHKATVSTSWVLRRMSKLRGLRPREAAAVKDCMEQVRDSLYELARSVSEMGHVIRNGRRFEGYINDIQTWVSAALTDDSSCLDGLKEVHMKQNVKAVIGRQIVRISHLTSNSLSLINKFSSSIVGDP